MELTPEQQQAYYDSLPKKPAYQPSQRRRKRSKKGNRLSRSLIHVDQSTKDLLVAMSQATGAPQIQLVAYAIKTLSEVMQAEQLASELAEANKVAGERSGEPQRGEP